VKYLEPEDENLKKPEIRITLDYPEDLELVKKVYDRLYVAGKVFTLKEILELFDREPLLQEINRAVQEKYWKRFKKRANVKLKRSLPQNQK
jgi:spore coat polysaccharide biosynthesis protein SpsF